jgi:hypothetical protein
VHFNGFFRRLQDLSKRICGLAERGQIDGRP